MGKPLKKAGENSWVRLILVPVAVTLLAGTSAPWWLRHVFPGSSVETAEETAVNGRELIRVAGRLRRDFTDVRRQVEQTPAASVEFASLEAWISSLRQADAANGHAWYFAGEIARLRHPELFTSGSCLRPLTAAPVPDLDAYQRDFRRYLDVARTAPLSSKDDSSGEYCYTISSGYCSQRTAWIQHLLANDMYEEARVATDVAERTARLERASEYVRGAKRWRRPDGREGFEQCRDTIQLERIIEQEVSRPRG